MEGKNFWFCHILTICVDFQINVSFYQQFCADKVISDYCPQPTQDCVRGGKAQIEIVCSEVTFELMKVL